MKQVITCRRQEGQTAINGEMLHEWTANYTCLHNIIGIRYTCQPKTHETDLTFDKCKSLRTWHCAKPVNRQSQKNGKTTSNFFELIEQIYTHSCFFSEDRKTTPKKRKKSSKQSVRTTNLSRECASGPWRREIRCLPREPASKQPQPSLWGI